MSIVEKRLAELRLFLPDHKQPVGNYLGSKKIGELLFASGRVSDCIGEAGTAITVGYTLTNFKTNHTKEKVYY